MRSIGLLLAVSVCLWLGTTAYGDDQFPPDWRGNFGTVTAGWDYWGPEGLGPRVLTLSEPQLIQANPGGFADPWPAWAHFNSSVYVHDDIGGRQSVLEINEYGTLSFRLANYDFPTRSSTCNCRSRFAKAWGRL